MDGRLEKGVDDHQQANDDRADRRHKDGTSSDVLGQLDFGSSFWMQVINQALDRGIHQLKSKDEPDGKDHRRSPDQTGSKRHGHDDRADCQNDLSPEAAFSPPGCGNS